MQPTARNKLSADSLGHAHAQSKPRKLKVYHECSRVVTQFFDDDVVLDFRPTE